MKKIVLCLLVVLLVVSVGDAQTNGWKLDKAHSAVIFTVKHMVISEVSGKFTDFDITLNSPKEDFSDASVDAAIKTGSIATDNTSRDGHLKSDEFFNADKYPEIKYKSTSFKKTGDSNYKITGDLTIRDVTKSVTFDAVLNGTITTARGLRTGWKATTSINRFDYGVKWNRLLDNGGLIVGENVNITLNMEFVKGNQQ